MLPNIRRSLFVAIASSMLQRSFKTFEISVIRRGSESCVTAWSSESYIEEFISMTNEYSVIKAVLSNSFSRSAPTVNVSSNATDSNSGDIGASPIIALDRILSGTFIFYDEMSPRLMSDELWMSPNVSWWSFEKDNPRSKKVRYFLENTSDYITRMA